MTIPIDDRTEWLEADGLGGFASGTTAGVRTRRYHALLLAAATPPTGRLVLVNGCDAWLETAGGRFALSSQCYAPGILHPDGASRIARFTCEPWPGWDFELPDGTGVRQEIFVQHGTGAAFVCWKLTAGGAARLAVRPFLSGRDYHALHHENPVCRLSSDRGEGHVLVRPYDGVPGILMRSNGSFAHSPDWYRHFLYRAEAERGLDAVEDLASPGEFVWRLASAGDEALLTIEACRGNAIRPRPDDLESAFCQARDGERRRRVGFATTLDRAADAYIVRRGGGRTIVAGYPWFTDWGRDTFIALRGLCLAAGRIADACDILVEWAGAVSDGMLPNRFPDSGEAPEFNSVDASLWYVIAVDELLRASVPARSGWVSPRQRATLIAAASAIVSGYAAGTRFGIRMADDALLAAGEPGVQLTWMDAKVGDRVITPRVGKPVEIQALWLNALAIAGRFESRWLTAFERGRAAFERRFWNHSLGRLADVVDVNHVPGTRDDTFRPNQILAIGGLPLMLIKRARARQVVDEVEQALVTPLGLRSLARGEPGYTGRYGGGPSARDAAYHQGTVWPWLMGPFVEAWVRVRGNSTAARREARRRFLDPLLQHMYAAGLGHVSEIADAEPPFTPKGCPFQAWSVGEVLRLDQVVLAERRPPARRAERRAPPAAAAPEVAQV